MSTLNLFGDKNGGNSSNRASGIAEPGVPGVQLTPPVFCKSVNPITTRMADYAHHITIGTPHIFLNSATPVLYYLLWLPPTINSSQWPKLLQLIKTYVTRSIWIKITIKRPCVLLKTRDVMQIILQIIFATENDKIFTL